ncbi:MAG: tetratricopeptide repeat protein [Hyphomicrobiales bacterium]|nr:tetratricopeptide repeat protein [Hyphomicrobiales bacterium]
MSGDTTAGALRAAEAYLQTGNFNGALSATEDVLAIDPTNIQALELRARAYLGKGDPNGAEKIVDQMIEAEPEYDSGYRFKAVLLSDKGGKANLARAMELIEQACSLDPDDPTNYSILAHVQEQRDEFAGAEETYRQAIADFPWYPALKTEFSTFLVNRGRLGEARMYFDDVAEEMPGDVDVIILRGQIALREGRSDEAMDNALWALGEDATNPEAIQLLAQIKASKNPVMGIWWRYAVWISRFSTKQMWAIIIGIYLSWQFVFRGFLKQLEQPIPTIAVILWLSFCLLTWIAPGILNRMIKKELESVKIKDF